MSSPSASRSSAKRPRKGFESKSMLTCHTCRRSRRNGDQGKGMWPFICHYKRHDGTVGVSQYTPTYRKAADAMRADNPKTGALSSFCTSIQYGCLCLCGAWRKLGTAPLTEMELVQVQCSRSGHAKSSRAEEPRALPIISVSPQLQVLRLCTAKAP